MSSEVRLFGAVAVRPAIVELIPRFEVATGHKVAAKWDLNPAVKTRIEAGELFDVVVTNPNLVRDLAAAGKIRAGSEAAFGRIAMGVAAKAGSWHRDVDSVETFKQVLKDAASIAYANEGTSGAYFVGLLERLGIADDVRPKMIAISGGQTASSVGRNEAELAVVPVTSILAAAPAVTLLGPFPQELQSYIDFSIGISADADDAQAAALLSDYLTSAAVDDILASRGLQRR